MSNATSQSQSAKYDTGTWRAADGTSGANYDNLGNETKNSRADLAGRVQNGTVYYTGIDVYQTKNTSTDNTGSGFALGSTTNSHTVGATQTIESRGGNSGSWYGRKMESGNSTTNYTTVSGTMGQPFSGLTQTGFNTMTLYGTAAQTGTSVMFGALQTGGTGPPTLPNLPAPNVGDYPPDAQNKVDRIYNAYRQSAVNQSYYASQYANKPGANFVAPSLPNMLQHINTAVINGSLGPDVNQANSSNVPFRIIQENRLGGSVKLKIIIGPYLIRTSENATQNAAYSDKYLKTKIGTSGKEIGIQLKKLLDNIDKQWMALSEEKKQKLQNILGSPVNGWIAWDCLELNHENPMIAFPNSIPGTILDKTVTVNGRVYHAGEVNYIVYGRIIRLVTERNVLKWSSIENRDQREYLQTRERLNVLSNMLNLIAGYRMARKFGGLLGETNIRARQHWALAGWNHGEFSWENWVAQDSLKFNTGQRILKGEPYRSHITAEFGKKFFSTEIVFTALGKLK